jgi:DNA repair exonuclease SbcCD ATPase subunit
MDHTKLSDELRNQLLEAAAWGKAGITPVLSEATETVKQETEAAETEEVEELQELQEACHVCPLCTSELEEQISEESLLEHLDVVLGLVDRLSQINEGDEDIDEVIDSALAELLLGSVEEEEEE